MLNFKHNFELLKKRISLEHTKNVFFVLVFSGLATDTWNFFLVNLLWLQIYFNRKFIDTIVANSETAKTQVKITSFPFIPTTRIYFALKNTGACSAVLYSNVRNFFNL